MGLQRVANGFLSNGVIGKWNQYCGVKCVLFKGTFYLLEGDQADGYVIHKISDSMMNAAGGEVCEAAVKTYIETTAIQLFYHEDGSSYASYNPEDFPIMDKHDNAEYEELYKEIIKMAKFS